MIEEKEALMKVIQESFELKRRIRQLFVLIICITVCLMFQAVTLASNEYYSSECEYIPMNCDYDHVTESYKCNYVKNPMSTQDDENYKEFVNE